MITWERAFNSAGYSTRGPDFNCQYPHGNLQLSVISSSKVADTQTYQAKSNTHKIKINKIIYKNLGLQLV